MADGDRSKQAPAAGTSRIYARGGSVSDMVRLLQKDGTHVESRRGWWLAVAGIAVAVAVVAIVMLGFLDR